MGNRAVITLPRFEKDKKTVGIYLHWNGGRDSVEAFLKYCELRGFRSPEKDDYGIARLVQVIANFFGGDLSIGVNNCDMLDTDNYDNGVYLIKDWKIVGRKFFKGEEQKEHDLKEMVIAIDQAQPKRDQLGVKMINKLLKKS